MMKLRAAICIGFTYFFVMAFVTVGSILNYAKLNAGLREENALLEKELDSCQEDDTGMETPEASGSFTNTGIVKSILDSGGVSFISATAQVFADGEYKNIVSVSKFEDIAYFTNTIDYMLVTARFSSLKKTLKHLSGIAAPYTYLYFDLGNKCVTIRVAAAKVEGSAVDSEFTAGKNADNEILYLGGDE